jgi:hypothetical protein
VAPQSGQKVIVAGVRTGLSLTPPSLNQLFWAPQWRTAVVALRLLVRRSPP